MGVINCEYIEPDLLRNKNKVSNFAGKTKKLMTKLLFFLFTFTISHLILAQEHNTAKSYEVGMEYTGELQTDFDGGYNFLNLLRLDGKLNLGRNVSVDVSTLSIGRAREAMLGDLQVFSNLETEEGIPLTLAVAGVEWGVPVKSGKHTFFVGIRNTGEDYFASDVTSFYTNSSCGIFPTISANFPIATYPFAAMSIHYQWDSEHWGAKATVYNGAGAYGFSGGENLFRVCPNSDGVFCMAQGEYKTERGDFFLGGSLYKSSPTMWVYGEHCLLSSQNSHFHLIGAYSHSFNTSTACRNFGGVGAKLYTKGAEVGIFTDYADFAGMHEHATELTVKVPIGEYVYVQPTLHYIDGSTAQNIVGMLRLGVSL